MLIRAARVDECEMLSELALRSKSYWGYDDDFLEGCRAELTVAPEDVSRLTVRVAEADDGRAAGFYAIGGGTGRTTDVWFFFVDLPFIGSGVGRQLFDDLVRAARSLGISSLRIDADPGAGPFYERMGAARVGEARSNSIPGRTLPRYELRL